MTRRARVMLAVAILAVAAGGIVVGRATAPDRGAAAPRPGTFDAGYRAGREDAFSGFDGGWALGQPYIVTLRRGPPGVTYRFARRWFMAPGIAYRVCGRSVCSAGG